MSALNTVPGVWNNIYVDLALPCTGSVKSWQYFAVRAGTFYATIWRPDTVGSNTYYTLVGKNEITSSGPGLQVVENESCVRQGHCCGSWGLIHHRNYFFDGTSNIRYFYNC